MRYYRQRLLIYLLVATVLFIGLAAVAKTTPYFSIDLQISRSLQTINFPGFANMMTVLSDSGWGMPLYLSLALITLLLLFLGKKLAALFIILISLLDAVLFFGIANLVNRPRPSSNLIRVDFPIKVGGFPSGHVLLCTLIFGFLIYLTAVYMKNSVLKTSLIIIFSCLIISIGVARIYSGQHWPSDVLGAYLLGSIGLFASIYFFQRLSGQAESAFPKRDHQLQENR